MSDSTPDLFPENGLGSLPADTPSDDECIPCSQPDRISMLREGDGEDEREEVRNADLAKVRVEYVVQQLYLHSCTGSRVADTPPFTILPPRDMNEIKMVAHIVWALSAYRSDLAVVPTCPPPPGPKVCDYIVNSYLNTFDWFGSEITAQKMFFWFNFMTDTVEKWSRTRDTTMARSIFNTFHHITERKLGRWLQRENGWQRLLRRCLDTPIGLENEPGSPSLLDNDTL